jgi:nucleotide-binding universal stress UspA family protein
LLRVVPSRTYAVDWSIAFGRTPTDAPADPQWEARRYLFEVAQRVKALSVSARWQVVTDMRPTAEAVSRHAGLTGADVTAMTSRGRHGLTGLFSGGLAERVARLAPIPVLICRAS